MSSDDTLRTVLQNGEIELQGQFLFGSNYTFLSQVRYGNARYRAIYKPTRGEQPLWDFPDNTLARREVAAYLVSRALGWNFVPLTVLREDGPFGPGSLQKFIEYDPNYHYFTFSEADKQRLRPVVLFDLLVNNADRKGSHVLVEKKTESLWMIDHGLCFHEEDKLRTVIWDFAGAPIPDDLLAALERLGTALAGPAAGFRAEPQAKRAAGPISSLRADLEPYLSPSEIAALDSRAENLLASRVFPHPPEGRRAYPWPLL